MILLLACLSLYSKLLPAYNVNCGVSVIIFIATVEGLNPGKLPASCLVYIIYVNPVSFTSRAQFGFTAAARNVVTLVIHRRFIQPA